MCRGAHSPGSIVGHKDDLNRVAKTYAEQNLRLTGLEAGVYRVEYWQDDKDKRLRINHVRYYTFKQLREGFEKTLKDRKKLAKVKKLLR